MIRSVFVLLFAAFALSACRSVKDLSANAPVPPAADSVAAGRAEAERYARRVAEGALRADVLTARVKMEVEAGGRNMSLSGTLRMQRGELIQLSLTMLGFEVARMEFTPTEVLMVDRVNTQFVRAAYREVSFLRAAQLDFHALEALFRCELFTPGSVRPDLSRFSAASSGSHTLLSLTDTPLLDYAFLTLTKGARLSRVTVERKDAPGKPCFEWRYDDFARLGGTDFPASMRCTVNAAARSAGFTLSLSRLDVKGKAPVRTTLSAKYKQRNAAEVLRSLTQP